MTQANTITDLGFVGGKHLYHLKAEGVTANTTINMPCDQIQAVVGGALDADTFTAITIDHEGNQVIITAEGTGTEDGATLSLFVLGL
jgi:hypothetical protein